jgi:hypothetical protein
MTRWWLMVPVVLILAGCQTVPQPSESSEVGPDRFPIQLVFENIPRSFWVGGAPADATTLFLSVFVGDDGYFRAQSGGSHDQIRVSTRDAFQWTRNLVPGAEKSGGWFRFHPSQPNIFDLDEYTVMVQTDHAPLYKRVFRPSAVLAQGWLQYDFIVSPEYDGHRDEHYLRALTRPVVSKARLEGSTFSFNFGMIDSRAVTGTISFYSGDWKTAAVYDFPLDTQAEASSVQVDVSRLNYAEGLSSTNLRYAILSLRSASISTKTKDQVVLVSYSEPAVIDSQNQGAP